MYSADSVSIGFLGELGFERSQPQRKAEHTPQRDRVS